MCNGQKKVNKKAAEEQAKLDAIAAEKQREMELIAKQREIALKNQSDQYTLLQKQQEKITADNLATEQAFIKAQNYEKEQHAIAMANAQAAAAERQKQAQMQQAAQRSLGVLGSRNSGAQQGPTAKVEGKKGVFNQARYDSPTKNLSVGSTKKTSGVGVNLGGKSK
tara:strand:+ start:196 stop:693 length:498 start_codon:yes stop_codon:yes gene_type:complete